VALHDEARSLVVKLLEHVLADRHELLAGERIDPLLRRDFVHDVDARQVGHVELA
jgi:hypothetical protein